MKHVLSPICYQRLFRKRLNVVRDIKIVEFVIAGNCYIATAHQFAVSKERIIDKVSMVIHTLLMDDAWQRHIENPFTLLEYPHGYSRTPLPWSVNPQNYRLTVRWLKAADFHAEAVFLQALIDQVKATPEYQRHLQKEPQ